MQKNRKPNSPIGLETEIRQSIGDEMRFEFAENEVIWHQIRRRRLDQSSLFAELVRRGDTVSFWLDGTRWSGIAVFAGKDYLTLSSKNLEITIPENRLALTIDRQSSGGVRPEGGSRTLVARLAEFELSQEPIWIWAQGLLYSRQMVIEVVATDHILGRGEDGKEVMVPLVTIFMLTRPRPDAVSNDS